MTAYPTTAGITSQVHVEMEAKYPGFIVRTQVSKATDAARTQRVWFSLYDAQRVADPKTFAY